MVDLLQAHNKLASVQLWSTRTGSFVKYRIMFEAINTVISERQRHVSLWDLVLDDDEECTDHQKHPHVISKLPDITPYLVLYDSCIEL